tara:strand:+ start:1106 stop:1264 length:159 start_codon:yes stop_codon:yes gene_type:complete
MAFLVADLLGKAQRYLKAGKLSEAEKLYKQALISFPNSKKVQEDLTSLAGGK